MDDAIRKKREQIRNNIEQGYYTTLAQFLLAKISRAFSIRYPASVWISALVICVLAFTPHLASLLFLPLTVNSIREIQSNASTLGILFVTILGASRHKDYVNQQISTYVLGEVQNVEDLEDLERWYSTFGNKRSQFLVTILIASLLFVYLIGASVVSGQRLFSIGGVITILFECFFMGLYAFEFVMLVNLHIRLSRYSYSLFFADPGSSELVDQLSKLFNSLIYLIGVITGIMTLFFAFWNRIIGNPSGLVASLIFLGLFTWGPLIIAFSVNQTALRKIISRGKWKSLNQIQTQIEQLQNKNKIPSQETLLQIRSLLEYHDYIKSRRNSTVDISSVLNFLNSILFPVLGFLLGSLKDIIGLFSK